MIAGTETNKMGAPLRAGKRPGAHRERRQERSLWKMLRKVRLRHLVVIIVLLGAFWTARDAGGAERNRLIFISDLHMNVDANYSWLVNHAPSAAQFLSDVNTREDVAELVILGDLLDD